MKPNVSSPQGTRRQFLAATTAGVALLPGLTKVAAAQRSANDQIQLGVIGIGPRCRTDLRGMLPHNNVRCVAIADVQESRRISGKAFVDDIQGTNDCALHRDFRVTGVAEKYCERGMIIEYIGADTEDNQWSLAVLRRP
jgi:hypothetical protein